MTQLVGELLGSSAWRLFVALAIGLFIGIERERRKGQGTSRAAAGLRTFALVALLGGIAAQTSSPLLVAVAGAFTAAAALVGYWLGDRSDPGLTTEVAMVASFALGVLAQVQPLLALGGGVVVAVLLALRSALHHIARDVLTERELADALIFGTAALVILPLLPDRAVGPFGLFNPFALWRLAVVLMALSAAGYAAARLLGPRFGLVAAGFASGFVSSTACIAAMGGRARQSERLVGAAAAGAVASVLGSLLYLAALVITADVNVLLLLLRPLILAIAATAIYVLGLAGSRATADGAMPLSGRAFDLKMIVLFSALVATFALVSTGLIVWLGEYGALASAVVTGLIDVHASSVTIATLTASAKMDQATGALAILLALSVNMASKMPAAFVLGPRGYGVRVSLGIAALLVGLWAGAGWQILVRS